MDMEKFIENRLRFPPEELFKYAKQYVAWSPEGTHLLAHGKDRDKVREEVKAMGHDLEDVLISYVPDPDVICMGGAVVD